MKIKRITLHNYRGYKHQDIHFVDGLNTLVGSGDAGKSAVVKACKFVLENDQTGNIIANDILDAKGKIKKGESCWVEIETYDGDVVRREKTRTENFYQINDKEPIKNLPRTGVPDDIASIFNMNEINIQGQFDSHFMLSDNASTVAKTLNKVANLEVIDTSVANIKSLSRKAKKDKDASDANLEKYTTEMAKFDFVDKLEEEVNEAFHLEKEKDLLFYKGYELSKIKNTIDELSQELVTIEEITTHASLVESIVEITNSLERVVEKHNKVDALKQRITNFKGDLHYTSEILEHQDLADNVLSMLKTKSNLVNKFNTLVSCAEAIDECEDKLKTLKIDNDVVATIDLIEELDAKIISKQKMSDRLITIADDIDKYREELSDVEKSIAVLSESIVGVDCPYCGQPMKSLEDIC
jgi:exonuclease SbcC